MISIILAVSALFIIISLERIHMALTGGGLRILNHIKMEMEITSPKEINITFEDKRIQKEVPK